MFVVVRVCNSVDELPLFVEVAAANYGLEVKAVVSDMLLHCLGGFLYSFQNPKGLQLDWIL